MKNINKFIQEKYLIDNNIDTSVKTIDDILYTYDIKRLSDDTYDGNKLKIHVGYFPYILHKKLKPILLNTGKFTSLTENLRKFVKDKSKEYKSDKYQLFIDKWSDYAVNITLYTNIDTTGDFNLIGGIYFNFGLKKLNITFKHKEDKNIEEIICLVFEFIVNYE